ncbi:cysteine/serine endopeptidase inhibitor [Umezawaea tangerina]|uniref:Rare lipoprotein A (RlpA)-like double-psi beta-barrel protein n=1 Tax=Umezawaea tangerina TaxID=84725 RepID=A0A2T0T6N4_9PSEU|nr:cysteine/serine endopeptidase inhibitor [Umezawaea tangerina]PRY41320.1 rare lipoprotein A (RlpA)-like double-psi beta-barrel protein [Umezawaea tangerina]
MRKTIKSLTLLTAAVALSASTVGTAWADIPFDRPVTGNATYYDAAGFGACGTQIDARTQLLVAVPASYWTTANPNNDPLCRGVSVRVTYNGRTVTVPVADKCPSCDSGHIDLSQPAFSRLADTALGNIPVTWSFVRS